MIVIVTVIMPIKIMSRIIMKLAIKVMMGSGYCTRFAICPPPSNQIEPVMMMTITMAMIIMMMMMMVILTMIMTITMMTRMIMSKGNDGYCTGP